MGYKKERLRPHEWIASLTVYVVISGFFAWLFYDRLPAAVLFLPVFPFFIKTVKSVKAKRQAEDLTDGFIRSLVSVSTSLAAGLSPENAFASAEEDMEKLYGKKAEIVKELSIVNSQVRMGQRLCDALASFAGRTRIDEIYDFSVVFAVAKDNGANFPSVISSAVGIMESGRTAEKEAKLLIRARQYEQRIMCVIPPGILAYLKLSSGSFIEVMYREPLGIAVMTVCLAVYITAIVMSEKIGDIRI